MGLFNKKELERIAELEKIVKDLEEKNSQLNNTIKQINNETYEELNKRKEEVKNLKKEIKCLENDRRRLWCNKEHLDSLENKINKKIEERDILNNEIEDIKNKYEDYLKSQGNMALVMESGVYEFHYHYEDSSSYEKKLKEIKEEQKDMVKWEWATKTVSWMINDSYNKGEKMIRDLNKLLLRAFNNECDNIIMNVKYATICHCSNKIKKSFEQLNKFVKTYGNYITEEYLELKLKELELRCGYVTMKQKEKEEQQRIREQMKEEERVRKELEAEEKKVEKEEQHFMNELNKLQKRMTKENEKTQAVLLKQIEELQSKLASLSEVKADIMNRRMNNKAGYVYIISNKGSFGENIYKIGTTRRLDPQIRVDELSNASVPFKYDVHAMIFSDDAFALEHSLHQIFDGNRVNKVNKHKEFFNVSIDEIEKAVKDNFNETVEFNKTILNEEYVLSLSMN